MKKTELKHFVIPLYLLTILLILIPLNPQSVVFTMIPIGLISLGILLDSFFLSFFGLSLFYMLTITMLPVASFDDSFSLYAQISLVLIPSFFLISQILQHHDITNVFSLKRKNRSALLLTLLISVVVLFLFYLIGYFIGIDVFFSPESLHNQIVVLVSISLLASMPFLLKPLRMRAEQIENEQ